MWGAITIIVLVFLVMFHKQINALISRIKSIGREGVILDSERQESRTEIDPRVEAENLMRQLDNKLILEVEDLIKGELSKKKLLGAEGVPVLIRYVSALSIAYSFSEAYRMIWGSQLSLLDYLNTNDPQPTTALRPFYNLGASQYPAIYQAYTFEQWLNFLKAHLLIREDVGLTGITVRGREFLTYLTTAGLSRNKAG